MDLSSSEYVALQYQFEAYCKKTLRGAAFNQKRKYRRQSKRESLFSELTEYQLNKLCFDDTYFEQEYYFNVLGNAVCVKGELIAKAIRSLDKQNRDIILLYFFLDKSDYEIAKELNTSRRIVQYQRQSTLRALKTFLEDINDK